MDVQPATIVARDGVELSANLFLPDGTGPAAPVPAILNMDPYRKDDWSAGWDRSLATSLTDRGYAYCRLDVRGTGSSRGIAEDEYSEAETRDGYDAVEWLAARPWCTGRVGMWGLSYGGFTALQVATLRPPHLAAIVPIQATDDRYTDDVHYVGGCMTVSELSQYAVSQVAMNALPPLPEARGERWREEWRARLAATPVWLLEWARRQRDGPYWRRGSVAPAYDRITAPILQLAGWMDEYVDAALRIQERCVNAPRRTIVGPWVHGLPDHVRPGPNVDWLAEMVRWFDRWLRDVDNGTDREPALTWFRREFTPPERFPERLDGAWAAVDRWIGPGPESLALALDGGDEPGRGRLVRGSPGPAGEDPFDHRPTAGVRGGSLCWGAGHPPNGLAADLRLEEPNGPVYTSAPLDSPLDVLGPPVAVVRVRSSAPVAHLVVRLGDVAPDGAVEQVSEGILNLTHRDGHAEPSALVPGRAYDVRVPLRAAGYRFLPGHRLRLSFASAHWPVIWPSPGEATLTIERGGAAPSRLQLPLAPGAGRAVEPPALGTEPAALAEFGTETTGAFRWEVVDDEVAGTVTVRTYEDSTLGLPDGRSTLFLSEALEMTASATEPGTGRFENTCEYTLERDGLRVAVVADGTTVAGLDAFDWRVQLRVDVDGERFFERRLEERIPRDLL